MSTALPCCCRLTYSPRLARAAARSTFHYPPRQFLVQNFSTGQLQFPENKPLVSFGTETDAALAPYLEQLNSNRPKRSRTKQEQTARETAIEEGSHDRSAVRGNGAVEIFVDKKRKDTRRKTSHMPLQHNVQNSALSWEQNCEGKDENDLSYLKSQSNMTKAGLRSSRNLSLNDGVRKSQRTLKTLPVEDSKPSQPGHQAQSPKEQWQIQKEALRQKFKGEAWNPRKKVSPDALEGIRSLHQEDPEKYTTSVLAQAFKISPEAVRRILKSNWRPSSETMQERRERWAKRHDRIWDEQAELGLRPKRRKDRDIENPDEFEENLAKKEALGEI